MSVDRAHLLEYFRQLRELGVAELFLDSMTAEQALAAVGVSGGRAPGAVVGSESARGARVSGGRVGVEGSGRPAGSPVQGDGAAGLRAALESAGIVAEPPAAAYGRAHRNATGSVATDGAAAANVVSAGAASDGAAARALRVLADTAAGCTKCGLHAERTSVVFGEGSPTADVVVVGEAPGQEEDRTGRPFVGRAGRLLDLMLQAVGFPRQDVYICNTLKCRPPGNRNPMPAETQACATFLSGQLDAIQPRVLLAVGKFAAQALLGSDASIGSMRGMVHEYRGTPLIVTYHPAYLLRSPQMTRVAWQDFQQLRRVLDEQARV